MDNTAEGIKLMARNGGATREWLDNMLAEHPYFTTPLLLYLKEHGLDHNQDLLARLAIASPDRKSLALQLGEDVERFAHFYPAEPQPVTPATDDAIDRFLSTYGAASPKEVEAINNAIFNPTPDYADILAAELEGEVPAAPKSEQDRLIDNFIADSREREKQAAQAPAQQHVEEQEKAEIAHDSIDNPERADDSMLQESLAKTYIKKRKYSQALEIIEDLNLRFPEKSIYFADQIRFLRKLVLNETITNNK